MDLGYIRPLAAREVQVTHCVTAGADAVLHLVRHARGKGAFAILRFHERAQLRGGHLGFYLPVLRLPLSAAAVGILRMLRNAEAEFAECAAPLLLAALMQRRGYQAALCRLLLLRAYLEPACEKLLRASNYILRRHVRRELQLVKQLFVVAVQLNGQTEHTGKMRVCQRLIKMKIVMPGEAFHRGLRIASPQRRKRGARDGFLLVYAVFKPQPEKSLVIVRILILLKRAEERDKLRIVIVPPRRADDAVPVQIRAPLAVIGLEIGRKIIAPGAVPYNV